MSRTEQKQEAGRFLEFRDLEGLAEYIGLYYGERYLDRDELNDFLMRYGAGIVCQSLDGGICCEIIDD